MWGLHRKEKRRATTCFKCGNYVFKKNSSRICICGVLILLLGSEWAYLKFFSEYTTSIKWLCKLLEISPSWHLMSKQQTKFCYRTHKKEKLHSEWDWGAANWGLFTALPFIVTDCNVETGEPDTKDRLPWATWHHESGGVEGRMNVRPVVTYRTGWKLSLC